MYELEQVGPQSYYINCPAKIGIYVLVGSTIRSYPGLLRHKVGVSVAAVRRGCGMTTVDTMNHFMLNKEMIVVGSTYWNMVYGKNSGDVLSDDEGLASRIRILKDKSCVCDAIFYRFGIYYVENN